MRRCPQCHARYQGLPLRCPLDGETLEETLDTNLGTSIGGWHLHAVIAEGARATVYEASRAAQRGALKLFHTTLLSPPRVGREVSMQQRIAHSAVAAVLDHGATSSGQLFLVTELIAGTTLRALLRAQGRLHWRRAVDIAAQVAAGLEAIHEAQLVHRDLKPENVMLEPHGIVKILDLGHALMIDEQRLTESGLVWGSAPYMSPEQVAALPVDGRSDLYALGIVLYEMLLGQQPFQAKASVDVMQMHWSATPTAPALVVADLPERASEMCLWLLAKLPTQRPHSARVARAALLGVLSCEDLALAVVGGQS